MVEKLDAQMISKVHERLTAKQRLICKMIDEGCSIDVPKNQRWHPSQVNNKDFLNKLNTASI